MQKADVYHVLCSECERKFVATFSRATQRHLQEVLCSPVLPLIDSLALFSAICYVPLYQLSTRSEFNFGDVLSSVAGQITTPPTTRTIIDRQEELQQEFYNKQHSVLAAAPSATILADIWTNRQLKAFVGFITSCMTVDMKRSLCYENFIHFPESHTGAAICRKFLEVKDTIPTTTKFAITDTTANIKVIYLSSNVSFF